MIGGYTGLFSELIPNCTWAALLAVIRDHFSAGNTTTPPPHSCTTFPAPAESLFHLLVAITPTQLVEFLIQLTLDGTQYFANLSSQVTWILLLQWPFWAWSLHLKLGFNLLMDLGISLMSVPIFKNEYDRAYKIDIVQWGKMLAFLMADPG